MTFAGETRNTDPELNVFIPDNDDRWRLAKKVAASATLSRSPRLSHLLLYLCERHLLQQDSQVTEQQIASEVFGRKGAFDPAADTIVRSNMLRLRQKLDVYFSTEGADEQLQIHIPRGGYVPVFEANQSIKILRGSKTESSITAPNTAESFSRHRSPQHKFFAISIGIGIFCIALLLVLVVSHWHESQSTPLSAKQQFWASLFRKGTPTLLVAADSGVVMLHGMTEQNSTLAEYLSRNFSREISATTTMPANIILNLSQRRYTSFVDLELFDRLTHLPNALSTGYSVRYARDIQPNDLKNSNVVLSGSQDANPWVELFEPQMNFVLHDDLVKNVRSFINRHPQPGENKVYLCDSFEYGVLAYLPNLSGSGNVLLIGGTSVAGTEAISDFLFEDESFEPFLEKISRKGGSLEHFEILLESRSLDGSASRSQIVAYRTYP